MKAKLKFFWILIFSFIFFVVFYRWFTPQSIIGGDWPFYFPEAIKEFPLIVPSWNTWQGNGLGGNNQVYFLMQFLNFTTYISYAMHISWVIVYKILWFGLSIFLSVFSSIYLSKTVLPRRSIWVYLLSALIFTTNTYVLMLFDGGQMGVALAYSITPLVLAVFIKLIDKIYLGEELGAKSVFKMSLLSGASLAVQVMFDPRFTYLTLMIICIFVITSIFKNRFEIKRFFYLVIYTFVIPGAITLLLHASWILPYLLIKQNFVGNFGEASSGIGFVKFLSFASFSQTLSLLHPNWPENIFGKIYFMKPEFIILPLIAFSSLFFLKKSTVKNEQKYILFFSILALIGAFLAKGANPPFGEIYLWAISHIPGFVLFRDPTKFYLFTAVAFTVLIPYSIKNISKKAVLIFVIFWIFTIYPAISGQLKGTFIYHKVPQEYAVLKDFLYNQPEFFRTLWVPREQRFSFYNNAHPPIEINKLYTATTSAEIVDIFQKQNTQKYFENLSIKYVIVPYDSLGEFFQKDRKYDNTQYLNIVESLRKVSWLREINGFGKIGVFQMPVYKDHFSLTKDGDIVSKMVTPYRYDVSISIHTPQDMIFAENYNPYWLMKNGTDIIFAKRTPQGLMSFPLSKKGKYTLEIYFSEEDYYVWGRFIAASTLLVSIALLLILEKNKFLQFLLRK